MVAERPAVGVENLLAGAEGLDPAVQADQMDALAAADAFETLRLNDAIPVRDLIDWEVRNGILAEPIGTAEFFAG